MILNPAQICICPIQGCLAHMFPLIKHNTHAWRKQETQIQFSTGLRFPLMRKFDDQLPLGFPIILRLQAHSHAVDLRIPGLINNHLRIIGWQLKLCGRLLNAPGRLNCGFKCNTLIKLTLVD